MTFNLYLIMTSVMLYMGGFHMNETEVTSFGLLWVTESSAAVHVVVLILASVTEKVPSGVVLLSMRA